MSLDQKLRADGKKYIAASHEADRPWAKEIAFNLKLSDHSQTIPKPFPIIAAWSLFRGFVRHFWKA